MIECVLFRRGVVLVSRLALFNVLFSPDRLVERRFLFSFFSFFTFVRYLLEKIAVREPPHRFWRRLRNH
jgi:hypothetical protein